MVLTLPLAGWIKRQWPDCRIVFLGRAYTAPVIKACAFVDEFIDADELLALPSGAALTFIRALALDAWVHVLPHRRLATLAWRAGVPLRVGTDRRWWHWLTCNRMVSLSRRHSTQHEAELNLQLLSGLHLSALPPRTLIPALYGLTRVPPLSATVIRLLGSPQPPGTWRVVLHPKSQGSAREWPLGHFTALARVLHAAGHRVYVTGTAAEGAALAAFRHEVAPYVTDLTGQLTLAELLGVIQSSDALVGASTGPLHLAAAMGRGAVGLYPLLRPMHAGRWGPLGPRTAALVTSQRQSCSDCVGQPHACHCLREITPSAVLAALATIDPAHV